MFIKITQLYNNRLLDQVGQKHQQSKVEQEQIKTEESKHKVVDYIQDFEITQIKPSSCRGFFVPHIN
jgi:hypothetical protein